MSSRSDAPPFELHIDVCTTTVHEAQALMRPLLYTQGGVVCPACKCRAKVYKRPLPRSSVILLREIFRRHGTRVFSMPEMVSADDIPKALRAGRSSYAATTAAHFGLLACLNHKRADGGPRGEWALTEFGVEWLHGRVRLPFRRAHIYGNRRISQDGEGQHVTEVLPKFDLRAVMSP